jgi:hypothetical protein
VIFSGGTAGEWLDVIVDAMMNALSLKLLEISHMILLSSGCTVLRLDVPVVGNAGSGDPSCIHS